MSALEDFRAALVVGAQSAHPRVSAYEADSVNPPAAQLIVGAWTYSTDFDGSVEYVGVLRFFMGRTAEVAAQKLADELIDPDSLTSMAAALEQPSVLAASDAQYVAVTGGTGVTSVLVGDVVYLAVDFNLEFVI